MSKKSLFLVLTLLIAVAASGCSLSLGGAAKLPEGGVWKSEDGGATWRQVVAVPVAGGKVSNISNVDVRRIEFDPEDYNTLYLSTEKDGAIYTNDGGLNWQQFKRFAGNKVRSVTVDPSDKCNLYLVVLNRLFKSTDCGRFWKDVYFHQNAEVILTDVLIDYFDGQIVYVATSAGEILKSANGGETWATVYRLNNVPFTDLIIDPKDSRIIYVATPKNGIYKTIDAGKTWQDLGEGLRQYSGSQEYKDLIIDPSTTGGLILISKFGMLRTKDGGVTWEVIKILPAAQQTPIYSAAVNPKNGNEIYYATRTTLVKSTDGGQTWSSQKLPFTLLANRIVVNPENPAVIYMGTFNIE